MSCFLCHSSVFLFFFVKWDLFIPLSCPVQLSCSLSDSTSPLTLSLSCFFSEKIVFFPPFPHSSSFFRAVLKQLITFQLRGLPLPFYSFLFFRSFPTVLAVNPETCCSKTNTEKPGRGRRLEDSGVAVDWEMRGWWQAADHEF